MKAPIAVMSFNRPDYLAQVLESVLAQGPGALDGREIHLFQDGAVNAYSGLRYAADTDIEGSIATFRRIFPNGVVHHAPRNIGICENFYRAENYVFRDRGFECCYFLEDDLILSPCYLDMMDILRGFAESSSRVAYFAAYGDHYSAPEEQAQRRREIVQLDHHWAFGLLRRHWLKIREQTTEYHNMLLGVDYSRRVHRPIYALYDKFGAAPAGTSQDAAKAFACDRLGLVRIRTFATFARYIGSRGAHMTPEQFARMGFANTVLVEQPIHDLDFPATSRLNLMLAQQRAEFERYYRDDLPGVREALPARKLNPRRLCTAEMHAGHTPVCLLVRGILGSDEFRVVSEAIEKKQFDTLAARAHDPRRLASREEVIGIYHLLLHRDPDNETVIEKQTGRRSVAELGRAIINSAECKSLDARQEG
jgi:hypothetical protein